MKVFEESRAEQISDLKEASRFLGACFQDDILHGYRESAAGHLAEIRELEHKINLLDRIGAKP